MKAMADGPTSRSSRPVDARRRGRRSWSACSSPRRRWRCRRARGAAPCSCATVRPRYSVSTRRAEPRNCSLSSATAAALSGARHGSPLASDVTARVARRRAEDTPGRRDAPAQAHGASASLSRRWRSRHTCAGRPRLRDLRPPGERWTTGGLWQRPSVRVAGAPRPNRGQRGRTCGRVRPSTALVGVRGVAVAGSTGMPGPIVVDIVDLAQVAALGAGRLEPHAPRRARRRSSRPAAAR